MAGYSRFGRRRYAAVSQDANTNRAAVVPFP
jgi:hypothetical protein